MAQQPERRKIDVKKELREWAVTLLIALAIFLPIHFFVFSMFQVDGSSMAETLHDGERLAATIFDMKLFGPERFDVVICTYPETVRDPDKYRVKRVIGLPGETVEIRDGVTYIDGAPIDEPFLVNKPDRDFGPVSVPANHYFVMGDNRTGGNSHDSRYEDVGPLPRDAIRAKVRLRCWPLSEFRTFE